LQLQACCLSAVILYNYRYLSITAFLSERRSHVARARPQYQLVASPLLNAFERGSSMQQELSDEAGEAFLIFAEVLAAAAVPSDSIVVMPLTPPEGEEVLDFSFLARGKAMFVQLHEKPKQFMTYGHGLGY
jgi:hypothetical protein